MTGNPTQWWLLLLNESESSHGQCNIVVVISSKNIFMCSVQEKKKVIVSSVIKQQTAQSGRAITLFDNSLFKTETVSKNVENFKMVTWLISEGFLPLLRKFSYLLTVYYAASIIFNHTGTCVSKKLKKCFFAISQATSLVIVTFCQILKETLRIGLNTIIWRVSWLIYKSMKMSAVKQLPCITFLPIISQISLYTAVKHFLKENMKMWCHKTWKNKSQ